MTERDEGAAAGEHAAAGAGGGTERGQRGEVLAIVLSIAMLMATAYVVSVGWTIWVRDGFASASRDVVWMAPLSAAFFTVLLLWPLVLVAPRWTRQRARWASVAAATFLAVFAALLPWTQIDRFAAAVLAAGVGSVAARWLVSPAQVRRLAVVGVTLGASLLVAGGLVAAWTPWSARRALAALPNAAADAPNVLFLLLDTVRADALGTYGSSRATSPTIDAVAAGGVTFEHAVATAPWTLPSHGSIFTGEYPGLLSTSFRTTLDGRFPTLAEHFRSTGYETVGFTGNLAYTSWESGLARGFLRWTDAKRSFPQLLRSGWIGQSTLALQLMRARSLWQIRAALRRPQLLVIPKPGGEERNAQELTDAVLAWHAQRATERPWLAFVNYFDAHEDYAPPPPYRTRFSRTPTPRDLYDGEIAFIDDEIGRLLAQLKLERSPRPTLVVVTADHGEHFGERGRYGHGNSLYYAALHVPLILRLEGTIPAGHRVRTVVSLRDLSATISALAGLGATHPFPGTSLAITWRDPATPADSPTRPPSPAISELSQDPVVRDSDPLSRSQGISLVDTNGWHGIHRPRPRARSELYDVFTDPPERVNAAADSSGRERHARQREQLRALLRIDEARHGANAPRRGPQP